ncbi:MAG TPA: protein kinase [Terriglobales bacterium]|nr:protein kinase [Terriglobales bacterium]
MVLASGTKLGPYEIQSSLGAGGMGEVYRARDTRLERTVALKILPAAFSSDADRLARFHYEARILSTLNHPNVLAIYDVGEHDGVRYLVSEFLEGQTLRDKLSAGALSRWRLVEYALEIAKGLAAAHEKGIVHRDLKPENVFITRDDHVKVLDFGLAKQAAERGADQSATMTGPTPTTPGTVMGTVGYMSPEQVRGQPLDHRSDIFSFGAVLFEMASGKRAFRGDSSVETMNAILKEDVPELSVSGAQASPGLERIIRRCLEKKPERRFQSASDLAFALEALSGTSSSAQVAAAQKAPMRRSPLTWTAAALCIVGLLALAAWFYLRPSPYQGNFTQITFRSAYIRTARFAPGRTVVYGQSVNGAPMQIVSVRTDTFESQPLNLKADLLSVSSLSDMAVALDRQFDVTWVPTGRLARAPVGGGSTRELLDEVTDADWSTDGAALAVARKANGLFHLEYPPGKVLYQTSGYVSDLRFSPAGDQIAFLDHPFYGDDRGVVSLVDLQGRRRVLTTEFSSEQGLAWTPKGDEIWFTANKTGEPSGLHAVDLKGRTRLVAAAPIRMHLQDIAADGRVLLSAELLRWQVGIADSKTGRQQDLSTFQWPNPEAISNDGSMILLNSFDISTNANYRLYVQRTDGSVPVQIGEGAGTSLSADGKWATAIDPTNPSKALVIPTGIGEMKNLHVPSGHRYEVAALLPNGKQILMATTARGELPQTGLQDLDSGAIHPVGPAGRYPENVVGVVSPGPSPDGKFCVTTDGGGHYWLQPLDGSKERELSGITPGDRILQWHNDTNNLFVASSVGADVQVDTLNLSTAQRKAWTRFSPSDKTAIAGHGWVIMTPDGSRYAYVIERIYSTLFLANGLR